MSYDKLVGDIPPDELIEQYEIKKRGCNSLVCACMGICNNLVYKHKGTGKVYMDESTLSRIAQKSKEQEETLTEFLRKYPGISTVK